MADPRTLGPGMVPDRAKSTADGAAAVDGGLALVQDTFTATIDTSGIATPATNTSVTFTVVQGVITEIADAA